MLIMIFEKESNFMFEILYFINIQVIIAKNVRKGFYPSQF